MIQQQLNGLKEPNVYNNGEKLVHIRTAKRDLIAGTFNVDITICLFTSYITQVKYGAWSTKLRTNHEFYFFYI